MGNLLVEPVVLVVLAFASYRLAHVLAGTDTLIPELARTFRAIGYETDGCDEEINDACDNPVRRHRGVMGYFAAKLAELTGCPHCLGMWLGLGMLCVWATRWPWELGWRGWITALAIAGLQSFLTAVDGRR